MKATMKVKATENETKAIIEIVFAGKGFDDANEIEKMKNQFNDAEKIGMKWNHSQYEAIIELTPENANPFVKYAELHNIEIVQL